MFDLAGVASNAGMSEDESEALLAAYFGASPTATLKRAHAAMQCASLLREAMWSMVSELHLSAPGVDYVAYTDRKLSRLDQALETYRTIIRKDLHHDIAFAMPRSSSLAAGSSAARQPIIWPRITRPTWCCWRRGKLTSGSTWHAAGLVGQLRSSASITRVLKYSVDLYKRLERKPALRPAGR